MLTVKSDLPADQLHHRSHFCPIRNVSLGGMRVDLKEELQTGMGVVVIVAFSGPPERVMRMGRIAWVKQSGKCELYQTGLEFSDAGGPHSHVWRDAMIRRFPEAVPLFSEIMHGNAGAA
jgi:hypothetical protein